MQGIINEMTEQFNDDKLVLLLYRTYFTKKFSFKDENENGFF